MTLDGQPFTAPLTVTSVVAMIRAIGTPSPQGIGGFTYTSKSWSDGGAETHNVTMPSSATTYTVRYQKKKN